MSIANGFSVDLYSYSIGICYTIERKKITVFKYLQKIKETGKFLNLNPVPKEGRGRKEKQFYERCLYNEQSEILLG